MQTEILKIIEGGLERSSEKLRDDGEVKFANRITNLIENNSDNYHPVYLDEFVKKLVDNDSRLDMVEVSMSTELKEDIVLPKLTQVKIDNYIKSLRARDQFLNLGIDIPDSLLLYGPPGCGKTSIAYYIAKKTNLL
ncbi:AAA family ATPase [Bacillus aerius]|uniref:AAA family ATPase n=1 Tax=Bacillus aerius TaxID=293388 RepID=UPI0028162020|nr:AAA family ATPase [Bacillus aerius]WMT28931.1 AAA family ATPase [Bacillus aerius]